MAIVGGSREYTEQSNGKPTSAESLRSYAEGRPSHEWREYVATPAEATERGVGRRRTDHEAPER